MQPAISTRVSSASDLMGIPKRCRVGGAERRHPVVGLMGGWTTIGAFSSGWLALVTTIALDMASTVITTSERLTIRTLTSEDAPFMADLHGRAEVVDPLGMEPSTGVH
jgi:hypothetical protein